MSRALITGISGQDGSYLAEHLLDMGVEVHGILRRHSVAENQDTRLYSIEDKVNLYYGDILDGDSLISVIDEVRPDMVFNLAAQSQVRISRDMPEFTGQVNGVGVLRLLSILYRLVPNAKFYQASSSEMFGNERDPDGFQRLSTHMRPVSPYGMAKLYAYGMTQYYRKGFKKFACNGILFNHTSPRRGVNFSEAKIVRGACMIKLGYRDRLTLGNLKGRRDLGHSKDYTQAMIKILEYDHPRDWIIAMGESHSVQDIVRYVFEKLDMDYLKYIEVNSSLFRPIPIGELKGDSSESRTLLKWEPEYTFESILDEMIEYWLGHLKKYPPPEK